uniref:Uncharacterized protein n=1 Tax=Oryza meridionalis TaxID=40149 RepID=A0A0E0F083_9ORYZ
MTRQLVAAAARACSTLPNSIILSISGMTALAASSSTKRSAHAASSGVVAGSNLLTPRITSVARTHARKPPSTTSR